MSNSDIRRFNEEDSSSPVMTGRFDMVKPDLALIIVDDMQFSRTVVRAALERIGYRDVRVAEHAKQALEMFEERRPDVVLADWVMPGMNGLELTDEIRKNDKDSRRYTSIILFTGKDGDEPMMEAFARGVDDYLTKPVNDHSLAARVTSAGRIAALQNEILRAHSAIGMRNERLQSIATIDPQTSLGNRRFLIRQLEVTLSQVNSRGGSLCLALLDVDDFVSLNTRFGSGAHNEVVSGMAGRLRGCVRPTDTVARTGLCEYGVLAYAPEGQAFPQDAFTRLAAATGERPLKANGVSIVVSICVGSHYYGKPDKAQTATTILDKATANLRNARKNGKEFVGT